MNLYVSLDQAELAITCKLPKDANRFSRRMLCWTPRWYTSHSLFPFPIICCLQLHEVVTCSTSNHQVSIRTGMDIDCMCKTVCTWSTAGATELVAGQGLVKKVVSWESQPVGGNSKQRAQHNIFCHLVATVKLATNYTTIEYLEWHMYIHACRSR